VDLRYGLNPHQQAIVREDAPLPFRVVAGAPSYVNLLDALNAWSLVSEMASATGEVAATSFKHVSPAGAALDGDLDQVMQSVWRVPASADSVVRAYVRARDADPKSSFGDMIAVSAPVTAELAAFLATVVADGIIAPSFEEGTVAVLAAKKRGTFLTLEIDPRYEPAPQEARTVFGVCLVQQRDDRPVNPDEWQVAVGRALSKTQRRDAVVGMSTLRRTQSNSVLFAREGMCLGIGAGQQSRIDCTRLAGAKIALWWLRRHPALNIADPERSPRHDKDELAGTLRRAERPLAPAWLEHVAEPELSTQEVASWLGQLRGVTAASDGYLPFADNIQEMARYGVECVVEPGGSMRSPDVTEACHDRGITLVHTAHRLFHH
jgi:phosphoribosylaminoimidazolecarboxamide formyltransferase/IMP cyclohydrolase